MQKLQTALNKIMTYRIKVFIVTDSVEMPDEANNSYVTPVGNTFRNSQHVFICHSHMASFTRN